MRTLPEKWRVSWKCPNPGCDALHVVNGTHDDVIAVAYNMTAQGVGSILIQEETTALMAEMDMAEDGIEQPALVENLTDQWNKMKRNWRDG